MGGKLASWQGSFLTLQERLLPGAFAEKAALSFAAAEILAPEERSDWSPHRRHGSVHMIHEDRTHDKRHKSLECVGSLPLRCFGALAPPVLRTEKANCHKDQAVKVNAISAVEVQGLQPLVALKPPCK